MKQPKLQKYTVWFDQINAQMITVKARTPKNAAIKAAREWKHDNSEPPVAYMEDENGVGVSQFQRETIS